MSSYAPINAEYVVDQDTSVGFTSKVVDLRCPLSALNYQVEWELGVKGHFIFEASIFPEPYKWETIINCEEIVIAVDGTSEGHCIVALTYLWLSMGFVRVRWEPDTVDGSIGNTNIAIRVVPI